MTNIKDITGVGKKTLDKLKEHNIYNEIDIALMVPKRLERTSYIESPKSLMDNINRDAIISIYPIGHTLIGKAKNTLITKCSIVYKFPQSSKEDIKSINLVHMRCAKYYTGLMAKLPINQVIYIKGKLQSKGNQLTIYHPDILDVRKLPSPEGSFKVYKPPISQSKFDILLLQAMNNIKHNYSSYHCQQVARHLHNIHYSNSDIESYNKSIERMKLYEAIAYCINVSKQLQSKEESADIKLHTEMLNKIFKSMPFSLSKSQIDAIKDIDKDGNSGKRVIRLVQGDVGSGKTAVIASATCLYTLSGYQSMILSPSVLLARQIYEFMLKIAGKLNISIDLIDSSTGLDEKKRIARDTANNKTKILIGTHAALEDYIEFKNLKFIVVDEQHKFGVTQRQKAISKGSNPNVLYTTATPIPRTLAHSLFNNIKVSNIYRSHNNTQVITSTIPINEQDQLIKRMKQYINKDRKVFWVCATIEDSSDLTNVNETFDYIKDKFDCPIYIMHGNLSKQENEKTILDFKSYQGGAILLTTTMIEVGIDISDANIIIIQNPEKFGLAQLHQMRGRVGRGSETGYCIILYSEKLQENSIKRLHKFKNSNNGNLLALYDMKQRGHGNVLGLEQSGSDLQLKLIQIPGEYYIIYNALRVLFYIKNYKNQTLSKSYEDLYEMFYKQTI